MNERVTFDRIRLRWHVERGYRGGWNTARQLVARNGRLRGSAFLLAWLPAGTVAALVRACRRFPSARGMVYEFLRSMSGQLGKVGYVVGLRAKAHYGGSADPTARALLNAGDKTAKDVLRLHLKDHGQ